MNEVIQASKQVKHWLMTAREIMSYFCLWLCNIHAWYTLWRLQCDGQTRKQNHPIITFAHKLILSYVYHLDTEPSIRELNLDYSFMCFLICMLFSVIPPRPVKLIDSFCGYYFNFFFFFFFVFSCFWLLLHFKKFSQLYSFSENHHLWLVTLSTNRHSLYTIDIHSLKK